MKKLAGVFWRLFPLWVLLGLRLGCCALFGSGDTPTPNYDRSLYRYQAPVSVNWPPLGCHAQWESPVGRQDYGRGTDAAGPNPNPTARPLCEKGRFDAQ
jgi:hypothetical protein